jgi:hypothetical protein
VKICYIERYRWDKHRQCWQLVAVFDLPIGKAYRANSINGKPKPAKLYAVNGNHDWDTYIGIARRFVHKVRFEDRADFLHDIVLEMAKVKAKYEVKGKPLTEAGLMRIASYEVTAYWEKHKLPTMVVDCGNCSKEQRQKCRKEDLYAQCPKAKLFISLNQTIGDGDGKATELWEVIADDNALDQEQIDAWLDAKTFLLSCPKKLGEIAYKMVNGEALNNGDRSYLKRFRKDSQLKLL